MVLQEVKTCKNVPQAHSSISSNVPATKKKRYAKAKSKKVQLDTETGTEIGTVTCEPVNKKQKLEPGFHSSNDASGWYINSSETVSASTVQEPMEEWLCYEECASSDGWAANITLAMKDWPSMDCDGVVDNSSIGFPQGMVHDSWMGTDGPKAALDEVFVGYTIPVSTMTTVAVGKNKEHTGVLAKDLDKDLPPDTASPKSLTFKHTRRKHRTSKAKKSEDTSTD
ncbi:hypothetical protein BGZ92_004366, partial [Podila epicladia]